MKRLHLLDTKQFMYAGVKIPNLIRGKVVTNGSTLTQDTLPAGSISYLFSTLKTFGGTDTIVACCDRFPAIKTDMYPRYKENRNRDKSRNDPIEIQSEMVEEILNNCGINVIFREKYEADDIICNFVEKYYKEYDLISIHTGDADLAMCVKPNVELLPVTSKNKHVTFKNYRNSVDKDCIIEYNTSAMHKVLDGCSSDTIPGLDYDTRKKAARLFGIDDLIPRMGEKKYVRGILEYLAPEALKQFDLVYPLDMDIEFDTEKKIDLYRVEAWGSILGNKLFRKPPTIPDDIVKLVDEFFIKYKI